MVIFYINQKIKHHLLSLVWYKVSKNKRYNYVGNIGY